MSACNTALPDISKGLHQIVPLKIEELKPETTVSSQSAVIIHINSAVVEIQNGATNSVIENTLRAIKNLC